MIIWKIIVNKNIIKINKIFMMIQKFNIATSKILNSHLDSKNKNKIMMIFKCIKIFIHKKGIFKTKREILLILKKNSISLINTKKIIISKEDILMMNLIMIGIINKINFRKTLKVIMRSLRILKISNFTKDNKC